MFLLPSLFDCFRWIYLLENNRPIRRFEVGELTATVLGLILLVHIGALERPFNRPVFVSAYSHAKYEVGKIGNSISEGLAGHGRTIEYAAFRVLDLLLLADKDNVAPVEVA